MRESNDIIGNESLQAIHWYFMYDKESKEASAQRAKYHKILMNHITETGYEDEDGHIIWTFPDPFWFEGTWYTGFKKQRRVSEYIDEDKARELVSKYHLEDRCLVKVVTYDLDLDELYAANQEGIVSDDEIDSIIGHDETWALVKVKQ